MWESVMTDDSYFILGFKNNNKFYIIIFKSLNNNKNLKYNEF